MNERDVRLTYRFLGHENETELRMIDPTNKESPLIIHVQNENDFVRVCAEFDGKKNIYVGINERIPKGTKCDDVICINAIVLDIDSKHPKSSPATQDERHKAKQMADTVMSYLKSKKRFPFMAMSGNGWQIWLKVKIPVTIENKKKYEAVIKEFHREIMREFSSDDAKIDNIGDLARVIKVIGTTSIKLEATKERPNLESYWLRRPIFYTREFEWETKLAELSKKVKLEDLIKFDDIGGTTNLTQEEAMAYVKKMAPAPQLIFNGEYTKRQFKSRSEAEFYVLLNLMGIRIPPAIIYSVMTYSKIGKWNTANERYRTHSIEKAFEWITTHDNPL
jgi:hypothetical protein